MKFSFFSQRHALWRSFDIFYQLLDTLLFSTEKKLNFHFFEFPYFRALPNEAQVQQIDQHHGRPTAWVWRKKLSTNETPVTINIQVVSINTSKQVENILGLLYDPNNRQNDGERFPNHHIYRNTHFICSRFPLTGFFWQLACPGALQDRTHSSCFAHISHSEGAVSGSRGCNQATDTATAAGSGGRLQFHELRDSIPVTIPRILLPTHRENPKLQSPSFEHVQNAIPNPLNHLLAFQPCPGRLETKQTKDSSSRKKHRLYHVSCAISLCVENSKRKTEAHCHYGRT